MHISISNVMGSCGALSANLTNRINLQPPTVHGCNIAITTKVGSNPAVAPDTRIHIGNFIYANSASSLANVSIDNAVGKFSADHVHCSNHIDVRSKLHAARVEARQLVESDESDESDESPDESPDDKDDRDNGNGKGNVMKIPRETKRRRSMKE